MCNVILIFIYLFVTESPVIILKGGKLLRCDFWWCLVEIALALKSHSTFIRDPESRLCCSSLQMSQH